jgi:outer membrane translocation and assembly module TamA
MTDSSNDFSKLSSDMTVHASFSDPANLVLVLGLGGAKILSKNFEFFQASTIGAGKNLHGFRKDRYAGKSSLYGSLEMRLNLFEFKSYVLPGTFGMTTFYDIGRVWLSGESSKKWHSAYGGGFYFMPFNMLSISMQAGFSGKEKIFNFTVGTDFNFIF